MVYNMSFSIQVQPIDPHNLGCAATIKGDFNLLSLGVRYLDRRFFAAFLATICPRVCSSSGILSILAPASAAELAGISRRKHS